MKFLGYGLTRVDTLHRLVRVDIRLVLLQTCLLGLLFSIMLAIPVALYQRAEARLRQADQERLSKLAPPSIHQEMEAASPRKPWLTYGTLTLFSFLAAGGLVLSISRHKALALSLENLIDKLPVLIAYIDAEQRYRFNNMAYQNLFRLSPRQIYGQSMKELLGESAYREIRAYVEQALAGETVTFERHLALAGTEPRDLVVNLLPDPSPQGEVRGFYLVADDISLIKQAERSSRQRMLEMAQISRLASMGEMATEIAHEINQPLAAISMYSAASLRTLPSESNGSPLGKWLETIHLQAKRASEIVRRVRRFVQMEEPERGPVNLNQVAGEVAALLLHESQAQNVEIVLQLKEDLPTVQGEFVLLEQLVFNLMRNAMDALLPQPDQKRITLTTTFDAEQVYLDVQDTGPGVDPELGERIFEPFVTTKNKGTGMGLAISRSIIESHTGSLGYAINPEGGTTFTIRLPRV